MEFQDIREPFLKRLRVVIDQDPALTEASLAVRAGLDNSAIRKMFQNSEKRSPRIDTARRICEALGTTLEEFLSDAQTEEEREIVRLLLQLPVHLRRQLLGYGQALVELADPDDPEGGAKDESTPDHSS